ncbi:hypothetical protein [Flavobacterium ajazii]|uniref:hypothetical protein n=1 Tax=Flavobacterium ajazii TaxID=2692318 RepID=UPI0013D15D90|nr:hypothetical protein [Flavobacterium ajazii]
MQNEYFSYSCTVNGQQFKHKLKIVERFIDQITICPVCGAENCGGPDDKYVWAEFDNEKLALHFGDGEFERYLSFWHYEGITEDEYKSLPNFIKDFNEGKGWDNDDIDPNSIIDPLDFKNSLDVIKNSKQLKENDEFLTSFYPKIMKFIIR